MLLSTEEILLLPDYIFIPQCCQKYKVDKKSYRLIDRTFYQYGVYDRVERRRHLLSFLEYNVMKSLNKSGRGDLESVKLKEEIQEYLEESFILLLMRELAIS